jgi:hypothetical protein
MNTVSSPYSRLIRGDSPGTEGSKSQVIQNPGMPVSWHCFRWANPAWFCSSHGAPIMAVAPTVAHNMLR